MASKSIRNILAQNIRRRRENLGISQKELAELAGFHRTYMNSVERAKRNIGIDGVERIAKALKMELAEMFTHSR
ncbi:MAG TPA: helix-turn-helix transcriptional regulator [Usitatibacter sp.]|jgi:transcriptional regulator with XRE-family HTH domain|nr:helix-turn-helix transcriptional regulator [Usitatibacter sp.]